MDQDGLIHLDRYGRVTIGTIQGTERLDQQHTEALRVELGAFVAREPGGHLLLNLHHVDYLSSAILTEFLRAEAALRAGGGGMRVCALQDYIANVFQVTQLDTLFKPMPQVRVAAEAWNAELT